MGCWTDFVTTRWRRRQRSWRWPSLSSPGFYWLLLALAYAGLASAWVVRAPQAQPTQSVVLLPNSAVKTGSATLIGRASVIDGDTIRLQGESVRLNGIDAPESRQLCDNESGHRYACGRAAANALDEFLAASRPTRCDFVTRDRYKRVVGTCFRADGADVSAWLVRNGYAVDWPRYSGGLYLSDQAAARARRAGIWQGQFQMPWDWRSEHK